MTDIEKDQILAIFKKSGLMLHNLTDVDDKMNLQRYNFTFAFSNPVVTEKEYDLLEKLLKENYDEY
jgi:hypothetical protein